jgi:uncharacterized protein YhjY with autotransporter beta-barrel domain
MGNGAAGWLKWLAGLTALMLAQVLVVSQAQAQHTSAECPAQTATVTSGGTVTINITDCATSSAFFAAGAVDGGSTPVGSPADFPDHGSANLRISGGQWFLDYSHNGTTGVGSTDIFEFTEATATGNGDVRVTITINASASPITVTPGTLPTLTAGNAFSQALSSAGGLSPYTYTLQSGALPPGLSLSSGGVLSGSPTQRGAYSFSVRSTDSTTPTAQFVDKGYTGTVQSPSLSLAANSGTAIQGVAFNQTLVTNGGVAPYTYQLETGSWPTGISISSGGVISGTTNAAPGNYAVTIRVTDSSTGPGTYQELETYTLTVSPPPSVTIAVAPASVSEDGATNLTYTVTRSLNLSSSTTVNIATGGTATSGSDFTGSVTTVTIPANATTATITINPSTDSSPEADETVILTVAAGTGYTVGAPASATGTILNDDIINATIAVAPASVSEDGSANLVYTVTLSQASASAVSVNYSVGGTATNGTDYASIASPLTIPAGSTTGTITVNPTADTNNETNETVILTLTAGSGYTVGGTSSATGTITNDDGTSAYCPTLSATVAWGGSVSINAGACTAGFGLGTIITAPTHGTATVGAFGPAQPINYAHNGTSGTTDTFVVNDGEAPPNNQIRVNITILPATSSIVVNPGSLPALTAGTLFSQTLTSTGGTAPYGYSLSSGALPVGLTLSAGGVLSGTPTQRGSYTFSVRSQDALGDFATKSYTGTVLVPALTITPATATAVQNVPFSLNIGVSGGVAPYSFLHEVVGGALPPGMALSSTGVLSGTPTTIGTTNFQIRVTDSSTGPGSYFELENFSFTVTTPPTVSIAVAPATVAEDGAANLVYTVTRSASLATPTVVNLTTGGTATSGTDYAGGVTTVTIPANATTATITIDPAVDAAVEPDETVILTVAAGTGYTVGAPSAATGTIQNDDVVNLTINDVTVTEGNSGTVNAIFTVSLSAPAGPGGVSFDIATANGSAASGTDYVQQSLTGQTIPAGSSTYTFNVAVTGDVLNEASETFFVNVTNVTGATVTDGQGLGTITNDDALPSLSVNDVTLTEGNAGTVNAVFTVTLSAPSGQTVSVNYATANGTATQPADYTSTSGTAIFPIGSTTQTIGVPVIGELVPEANESFVVNLSAATNATIADNQGTGTITNDDVPVTVSPTSLPGGTVAAAYSQTITASGGAAPYSFAVTAGALPAGLTLSPGGSLTGTPTAGGSFDFTVTVTDSSPVPGPFSASQAYTLTIAAPTITLPTTTLAGGTLGSAYSANITAATGGTSPYSYTVTAGAIPGGLTLNSGTGAITGTPTALGTFNFTIRAADSSTGTGPYAATQSYSISVTDVAPNASNSSATVAYNAAAANVSLSLSGGAPTSLAIGTAPAHGTATVSGTTISYQPTAGYAGPDSFSYTATNSGGISTPATVTITVQDPVVAITAGGSLSASVGSSYSQTFSFNGGAQPWSGYQVTNLPAGLSITGSNANSVTVSGTPTQAGSFNLNVSATDSSTGNGPFTIGQAFTLTVAAPTLSLAPAAGTLTAPYAQSFTQSFSATGGTGSYSYALTGTLPAGLNFTGDTISGAPSVPGSYAVSVTATDTAATGAGAPFSVTQNYTIQVPSPTITVLPATLPDPVLGNAYVQNIGATGGAISYDFAVTAGRLPNEIFLSGGTIAGTSYEVGTFNFTITVTDGYGQSGSRAYSLTIAPPVLTMTPAPGTLTAPYATAYNQAFAASGGSGTFGYALTGTLPAGLSFSGNSISGTPTVPGSYNFSITATDLTVTGTGAPFTITQNYTLDVPSPAIAVGPTSLPGGTAAASYSQTISATGGVTPFGFTVSSGVLPAGLSLSTGGVLSGTPTAVGSFAFTITATDANGQSGSRSYTITIAAPALALTPASGSFSVAYGGTVPQSFTASGGNGPYSYAATGSLPAGVTLNSSTGALSGSTIAVGNYSFTIIATDTGTTGAGAPFTATGNYTLVVAAPTIAITPASLPGATVGNGYSSSLSATGGAAPHSFAVTAGALPAGVSLSASGALAGTPTAGGSFTFTVTASDSSSAPGPFSASQAYTLTVAAPIVTLPATALPGGQNGAAYSASLNPASGGTAPFSYAVTGGALPSGIALSSSGSLSGTVAAFGSFTFTVTATDSSTGTGPYSASQNYSITIVDQPPVAGTVAASLPYGAPTTAVPLNLTGGAATAVAIATGPANGTATVSGTAISYQPNASFSGTDSFTYTATNSGGTSAPATVTITVGAPVLSVTASGPLTATVGQAYSQTFTFAGGTEPFGSHQVTGLPAGLALTGTTSNSVTVSGTPRAQGMFTLSVSASDSSTGNGPFTASQSFSLNVAAPALAIAPASGSFNAPYAMPFSQGFSASGGIGGYSYALGGTLPAGMSLNTATGTVSGTPTATGSFAFTITATDTGATGPGAPFNVQGSYNLNIAAPTIAVTPTALPGATAGTAYSATLIGSGAVAPYSFTLTGGTLPGGVTLSTTGQLSGTPIASGSFPFTVTVRDANGQTGTASLTLAVSVPTLAITPATLPTAVQGIAYNQTMSARGGVAPYSFAVSAGSLPAGLTLNTATGAITGTPTGSGIANFSITVTDSTAGTSATATIAYALQITARPDPATDPEVRGLVQAQVMASRRFADAQVNNFMRRLESLHGGGGNGGGFQNSLRISAPGYCEDSVTAWTNSACSKSESKLGPVAAANANDAGDGTGSGGDAWGTKDLPWTLWAGGTIRFGDRDPNTGRLSQKFESEGISIGADYRFSPSFAAGIGIGLGRDTVEIGDNGSQSQGEAKTVAVYGSHALGSGFYIDWLGGYQWLDFDLRRYVTSTGALINSNRTGRQWFVTGSTGADIETGNWLITPYARLDLTRGTLNGYTENSGSLFDLRFLRQDVNFTSLGLGTRASYRHHFKGGTFLPRLRLEYSYDLERNADAQVAYLDLVSGPFSTIPLTGLAREQLMVGLGAELQLESAIALELEYLNRIATGSGSDQAVQVGVSVKF